MVKNCLFLVGLGAALLAAPPAFGQGGCPTECVIKFTFKCSQMGPHVPPVTPVCDACIFDAQATYWCLANQSTTFSTWPANEHANMDQVSMRLAQDGEYGILKKAGSKTPSTKFSCQTWRHCSASLPCVGNACQTEDKPLFYYEWADCNLGWPGASCPGGGSGPPYVGPDN